MPRGVKTSPETVLQILDVGTTDPSLASIAATVGVPLMTVQNLMRRYEPVAESLRSLKRDWFVGLWQSVAAGVLGKLQAGLFENQKMSANDAKAWAVTAGIATEKILLLTGQPTMIVEGVHEHRHELGPLLERLASVSQRVRQVPRVVDVTPIDHKDTAS